MRFNKRGLKRLKGSYEGGKPNGLLVPVPFSLPCRLLPTDKRPLPHQEQADGSCDHSKINEQSVVLVISD